MKIRLTNENFYPCQEVRNIFEAFQKVKTISALRRVEKSYLNNLKNIQLYSHYIDEKKHYFSTDLLFSYFMLQELQFKDIRLDTTIRWIDDDLKKLSAFQSLMLAITNFGTHQNLYRTFEIVKTLDTTLLKNEYAIDNKLTQKAFIEYHGFSQSSYRRDWVEVRCEEI